MAKTKKGSQKSSGFTPYKSSHKCENDRCKGERATFQVINKQTGKEVKKLCDQHVTWYQMRPDTYEVISLMRTPSHSHSHSGGSNVEQHPVEVSEGSGESMEEKTTQEVKVTPPVVDQEAEMSQANESGLKRVRTDEIHETSESPVGRPSKKTPENSVAQARRIRAEETRAHLGNHTKVQPSSDVKNKVDVNIAPQSPQIDDCHKEAWDLLVKCKNMTPRDLAFHNNKPLVERIRTVANGPNTNAEKCAAVNSLVKKFGNL